MINQSEEILDHIKANPGTCIEGIVSGTGWNRHLVEVATKAMMERGLIKDLGKDKWGDSTFEAVTFGLSPFEKAASIMSGFAAGLGSPFSGIIADAVEQERLLTEIAAIANVTTDEVKDFYQTHPYSLEYIKAAIRVGAKLNEEDIKRTMEEKGRYLTSWDGFDFREGVTATSTPETGAYAFIVTLPNNDRREIKAAYMEVDGATLYFEDEDHETILAFGAGHWVWAERVEETT